jgi:hypothetical protein
MDNEQYIWPTEQQGMESHRNTFYTGVTPPGRTPAFTASEMFQHVDHEAAGLLRGRQLVAVVTGS